MNGEKEINVKIRNLYLYLMEDVSNCKLSKTARRTLSIWIPERCGFSRTKGFTNLRGDVV